ncbi:calcitonin gene-related peptide type 1 receptor isoform X2 [Macrosteles quadrilineatus]|uniref:calcitonin gene-related peptide type 1 receptor isoform X2 n=1 Tax=Macrosteles quadrilineatus TaxID=74068 RepID=UPI0023E2E0C2|nr:calcitonin gene-related peptide type 1 receptor isoform X2 [Macrosteles quadrilineatus]
MTNSTMNDTDVVQVIIDQKRLECEEILNMTIRATVAEPYCPGVFDGWSCWPDTAAGHTAYTDCPEFITGFDPTRKAHKVCTGNGTWFKHPDSQKEWSNYTTCVNVDDLHWRQQINSIYETGYLISLVALLLSLGILSYFKSLRCPRITLHMNLFTSFAANNALWVMWYRLIVPYPDTIMQNGVGCQILHVVLHYFLLTNYSWMLAEGFYLHTLLVSAFISEERLVKYLTVLAWTLPALFILVYTVLRLVFADTHQCWINESPYTNVLIVLVCFSMALNLVFLCNIVRVLLIKLRAGPSHLAASNRPSRTLLQAFRATLLLLPLLGLHYLLTPFRPPRDHPWERFYEVTSAITASFQGLCVATLFCFCNGEVIAQVKRRWQYSSFRPRSNSYTATTVSFVRSTAGPATGEDNV